MSGKIWGLLLGVLLITQPVFAASISSDPTEYGVGARPLSLGRAYTALADDASAIFLNPAGLALGSDLKVTSMYSTLFGDTQYLVLGGSNRTDFGTLGLGFISVAPPAVPYYESLFAPPIYLTTSSQVVLFSYAKQLKEDLLFGANLKYYRQSISGSISYESYGSGTELDLGAKFIPRRGLAFGLVLQNTLSTAMGGKFVWADNTVESIPARFKLGFAAEVFGPSGLRLDRKKKLNVIYDYETNPSGAAANHFGLEFWPVETFALRAGVNGLGTAMGMGFKYEGFIFDYAYNQYASTSSNVTNSLSIGYMPEQQELNGPRMTVTKDLKVKAFIDVPEDYFAREAIGKLASLGIITGFPDGSFRPEKTVTRSQLALILVRTLGGKLPTIEQRFFHDLPADHWSASYIKAAVDLGLVKGYADGTFRPNWPVKRAESVVVLSRFDLFPQITSSNIPYLDILPDHWAAGQIIIAKKRGMLDFVIGDFFMPQKELTRAEIAAMLYQTNFIKRKIDKLLGRKARS